MVLAALMSVMVVAAAPVEPWKTLPPLPALPAPTTRTSVALNGVSLSFATWGQGPAVLLLHGGAGHGDHWANQLPALAAKFQVITVDARGHGRSTRGDQPLSYALMADDVIALMDHLHLEQASIVGWSDGGIIGLDLALRFPARVRQLVLTGVNFNLAGTQKSSSKTFDTYFARCAADYARVSPTPGDWKGLMTALRPMWRTQPSYSPAQLSTITAPTLVLQGAHDELIRRDHTLELAKLIHGARTVWLPDASHFAMFQQPAEYNRALLDFLK